MNTWIVVIRKARGQETRRGQIVSKWLSAEAAKRERDELRAQAAFRGFNVWAMPMESY
jgi:hypothetical protein